MTPVAVWTYFKVKKRLARRDSLRFSFKVVNIAIHGAKREKYGTGKGQKIYPCLTALFAALMVSDGFEPNAFNKSVRLWAPLQSTPSSTRMERLYIRGWR